MLKAVEIFCPCQIEHTRTEKVPTPTNGISSGDGVCPCDERKEATAVEIVAEELKQRRWKETALKTRPKGDPAKVALAARLRAETTMTLGWIAERLGMGTRGYLNHLLYRHRRSNRK